MSLCLPAFPKIGRLWYRSSIPADTLLVTQQLNFAENIGDRVDTHDRVVLSHCQWQRRFVHAIVSSYLALSHV